MDRRAWLLGPIGLLVAPLAARAQQAVKVARIGWIGLDPAAGSYLRTAFLEGLRDLGYVEGRNLVVESRYTGGTLERIPAVATELAALGLDVIVAGATPHALAAKHATRSIPIVFAAASDPVASGLVTSLARPGGNVTGLSFLSPELVGKHLELLKQALPGASLVAVLWQPGSARKRICSREQRSRRARWESGLTSSRQGDQTTSIEPSRRRPRRAQVLWPS